MKLSSSSCFCCFCCFKQKTAYEMRISDWSSDVCSSDLPWGALRVYLVADSHGTRKMWKKALRIRLFLLVLACLAAVGVAPSGSASARPEVTAARIGETPERTRFVLEMNEDLPYRVFTLPDPFRVVLDLPEVAWSLSGGEEPRPTGLIGALRFGLFAPGTSRVVLDVSRPVLLQKVFVIPPRDGKPWRLVVDIEAVSREQYFAAENSAPGAAAISEEPLPPLGQTALPPPPPRRPADPRVG